MLVVCEASDPAKEDLRRQTQFARKVHATMLSVNGRHTGLSTHPAAMSYRAINSVKQINGTRPHHHHRHMWIITGPAGCGKSTVAQYLAKELSIPYIEGDDVCYTLISPSHVAVVTDVVFFLVSSTVEQAEDGSGHSSHGRGPMGLADITSRSRRFSLVPYHLVYDQTT